ncbi:hypothetical protein [Candidatus Albibeggiatoa sp. nov. NOAA]|uniref:hypothetical protein n=1 Tax=Candidatus Albibeggiatoa sp. nov. NOAA TaxID=3162724 RepID=UPI003302F243|nr:hypothetical protein [Thiotrichaceae bacterium]
MEAELNRHNCRHFLSRFLQDNELDVNDVALVLGCSKHTLLRILADKTKPSDEFLKQTGLLLEIGFEKYKMLSDAEKADYSEAIGSISGGAIGFSAITTAIATSGSVAGLSAAGISSGLAAIGSVIGGGMVAGVTVLAAAPIALGLVGYGVASAIKSYYEQEDLENETIDEKWEITE